MARREAKPSTKRGRSPRGRDPDATQDDFSGAELDRLASRILGSKRPPTARRRMRALEDLMNAGAEAPGDAVSGASNWLQLGPAALPNGQSLGGAQRVLVSGRIVGIAIDPGNPSTMYLAAARGGVWKTTDGGATWVPKSDAEASLAMGAIALAPSAPETIYAGTGEGNILYLVTASPLDSLNESYEGSGLLKSINGGDIWTPQGTAQFTGACFYRIVVHPTNADIAFAATNVGLYRTTNGGTDWNQLTSGLPPISASVIAATDVAIDPSTPDNLYVAFWGSGVYVSTNALGASPTFSAVTGGPTSDLTRLSLAVSSSSPSTVYAAATNAGTTWKGLFRTTGGPGGSWSSVALPAPLPNPTTSRLVVAVDISTPDIVYLGGTGLFKAVRDPATDTWSTSAIGAAIHADHRTFASHPTDHQTIFAGTDGGMYVSSDAGGSWSDARNTTLCITQIEFIDQHPAYDAVVFGGTQDNGTDQFRASEVFYHADDGDGGAVAVDQTTAANVLDEHFSISVGRSTQAGKLGTFSGVSSGLGGNSLFYPPFALDPTNQSNVAFGSTSLFVDAAQGTGGWPTVISLPGIGGRVSAIAWVDSTLLYCATSSGEVYRAAKSGGSWSATAIHAAPLPNRWIWDVVVAPADSNTLTVVVAGFGTSHAWRGVVAAGGASAVWSDRGGTAPNVLPDVPANSLVVDPLHASTMYAGTDVGVFATTDDGLNWTPFSQGLPNTAVYDLKIHAPSRLLRAATHGRGIWERAIDVPSSSDVGIYVRDNIMHTGRGAAPNYAPSAVEDQLQHIALGDLVFWWQCADVKVDSLEGNPPAYQMPVASVDFVAYESQLSHRDPQRGRTSRFYVQAHNRGIKASAVTAKAHFASAVPALPDLPADFWTQFPADSADTTHWTPIGPAQTKNVEPTRATVFEWDWTPPLTATEHSCLLVVCDCPDDSIPAASKVLDVGALVPAERHVGLKNLHVVDPPPADSGDALILPFELLARSRSDTLEVVVSRARGWEPALFLPESVARRLRGPLTARRGQRSLRRRLLDAAGRAGSRFADAPLLVLPRDRDEPLEISGLPVTKRPVPAFIVLLPRERPSAGTINVVQRSAQRIVGGNTFVIRPRAKRPRPDSRDYRTVP